ncbi:MAG TPA: hypothetical protein VIT68_02650 [Candidatus Gracilibacteria bacterium]
MSFEKGDDYQDTASLQDEEGKSLSESILKQLDALSGGANQSVVQDYLDQLQALAPDQTQEAREDAAKVETMLVAYTSPEAVKREQLAQNFKEYGQRGHEAYQKAEKAFGAARSGPGDYRNVFKDHKPQDYAYPMAFVFCYEALGFDADQSWTLDDLEDEAFLEQGFLLTQQNLEALKQSFEDAGEPWRDNALVVREDTVLRNLESKIMKKPQQVEASKKVQAEFLTSRKGATMSETEYQKYGADSPLKQGEMATSYFTAAFNVLDDLPVYPWMLQTHCDIGGAEGQETFTFYLPLTAPRAECQTWTVHRREIQDQVSFTQEETNQFGRSYEASYRASTDQSDKLIPRALEIAYFKAQRGGFLRKDGSLDWTKAQGGMGMSVHRSLLGKDYVRTELISTANKGVDDMRTFLEESYDPERFLITALIGKGQDDRDTVVQSVDGQSVRLRVGYAYSIRQVDKAKKTITFNDPEAGDGDSTTMSIDSFLNEFRSIQLVEVNYEKILASMKSMTGDSEAPQGEILAQAGPALKQSLSEPIAPSEREVLPEPQLAPPPDMSTQVEAFFASREGEQMTSAEFQLYGAVHVTGSGKSNQVESIYAREIDTDYFCSVHNALSQIPSNIYSYMLQTHCDIQGNERGRRNHEIFVFYFPLTAPLSECQRVEVTREEISARGFLDVSQKTSRSSGRHAPNREKSFDGSSSKKYLPKALEIAYMKAFQPGFREQNQGAAPRNLNWGRALGGRPDQVAANLLGRDYVESFQSRKDARGDWDINLSLNEAKMAAAMEKIKAESKK